MRFSSGLFQWKHPAIKEGKNEQSWSKQKFLDCIYLDPAQSTERVPALGVSGKVIEESSPRISNLSFTIIIVLGSAEKSALEQSSFKVYRISSLNIPWFQSMGSVQTAHL